MKIDIKIQSISDIITNSSSEVFCTITGEDVKSMYKILSPLFEGDPDYSPFLDYWEENEYDEDTPEMIRVNIPYSCLTCEFHKVSIEAILDKYIGDKNYQIEYEL